MSETTKDSKFEALGQTDAERAQDYFKVSKAALLKLVDSYKTRTFDEDINALAEFGGAEGLGDTLKTNFKVGLGHDDLKLREAQFGHNRRPVRPAKAWFRFFLAALDDCMLKVLLAAACISLVLDMSLADDEHRKTAWLEGAAIFIAVFLVAGVGSVVDWRKDVQFVKSRKESFKKHVCRVLREGEFDTLHHDNLHVGDIINVEYGMAIPVDGVVLQATQLSVDEAAMTGESDEMKKEILAVCQQRQQDKQNDGGAKNKMLSSHELPSPILMSGTNIAGGEGRMMCIMVGEDSCLGQIIAKLETKPEVTPLQHKLEEIATDIGKMGTYIAILVIHVLLFRYFLEGLTIRNTDLFGGETYIDNDESKGLKTEGLFQVELTKWLGYLIVGVAIIVVAVPEGLPLAVMISLAYSITKMLDDNNDVKRLSSCEIMGGADNICSDKTGTLTLNQMKVTNIWAGEDYVIPQTQDENGVMTKFEWSKYIPTQTHPVMIEHNIACNTAEKPGATDKAMTELLERVGCQSDSLKEKHLPIHKIRFPFSSKRKRMSTIIENVETKNSYGKRLHVKGASEIVKGCCSHFLDKNGDVKEIDDTVNSAIDDIINTYAEQALRTICLAYKDVMPDECGPNHDQPESEDVKDIEKSGLTLICVFGIMDIVRPEVPGAVKTINKAGVIVRMVTGDNIVTARAIAVNCNIITEDQKSDPKACMEGPAFYDLMGGIVMRNGKEEVGNFKTFKEYMPYMKVMARSRPEDKYLMVTGLRQMGCTVAVTGDGTNDAPALKKADVGFAMGKTGTDTCKEAADILITDDNFQSIVKACMWGRNVFDNIKRFLQFQLTVNVGACIITFIGACVGKESPLQAIQLLWVNLIMDSLASLALATEMPKPELLERLPQNREDYIVSRKMVKHILGQAIWQCIVLFTFLFAGEYMIPETMCKYAWKPEFDAEGNCIDGPNMFVFPGRASGWDGEDLYTYEKSVADGPSRHLTFIFTSFVFMQIFNMICSRKIHDEWNIFEGIFKNWIFIVLWFLICGGQVLITMYGQKIMICCLHGLDGVQWGMAIGIGATSFILNILLKLTPDFLCPKLGQDSVDDRRAAASKNKVVTASSKV